MRTRMIAWGVAGVVLFGLGVLSASGGSPFGATTPLLGPAPALAGDLQQVSDGDTFVSTDGGSAYLWRRNGDRLELLGQCVHSEADSEGQATFVWLPGVERRS